MSTPLTSWSDWGDWITWLPYLAGILLTFLIWRAGLRFGSKNRHLANAPARSTIGADPFLVGGTSEKRVSVRRSRNAVAILITDAEKKAKPIAGWVTDRSMGGVRLELDDAVPPLTVLNIRPSETSDLIPWVEVVVRNCHKGDEGWQVGCQYVKTPPSSVLWLFG
jgi:hypothetical protein